MILDPIIDLFRGQTITIPPLDGAFRANNDLEDALIFCDLDRVDNLGIWKNQTIASSSDTLYTFSKTGKAKELQKYPAEIIAIAVSASDDLVIALDNGQLLINDRKAKLPASTSCITAVSFAPDGTLWLANGSASNPASAWVVDLMEKNASGSVWKKPPEAESFSKVADGLAYPNGLLAENDSVVVSESWRHRLIKIDASSGKVSNLLLHIPGYPAKLSPTGDGCAWLSVFAPRNRLIELVLRETHYRYDMMSSVPRQFWIAPALSSDNSFLEPLQCGGMKLMGVHKAWAPSRSHGMVVRLDASMMPTGSFHSRANGNKHGTCSAIEHDGRLLVAAKGGNCILALPVSKTGESQ